MQLAPSNTHLLKHCLIKTKLIGGGTRKQLITCRKRGGTGTRLDEWQRAGRGEKNDFAFNGGLGWQ